MTVKVLFLSLYYCRLCCGLLISPFWTEYPTQYYICSSLGAQENASLALINLPPKQNSPGYIQSGEVLGKICMKDSLF